MGDRRLARTGWTDDGNRRARLDSQGDRADPAAVAVLDRCSLGTRQIAEIRVRVVGIDVGDVGCIGAGASVPHQGTRAVGEGLVGADHRLDPIPSDDGPWHLRQQPGEHPQGIATSRNR
jgi:hypothetical protein